MKLNWFSPLPPAKTDIAGYATRVLPTLSQSAKIVAWTDQPEWDLEIEQYVEVRRYDSPELPWPEVNRADLNIYHIGNNPYFHRNIWEISRRCPGLVILHDLKLHHFFEWIYHRQPNGRETYLKEMTRYYGLSGREASEKYWRDELTIEFMADHYPLTALALENALGVITHTKDAFNSIQELRYWPVAYAPLPYISKNPQLQIIKPNSPPYQLAVFGYISTNRRLDSVFEALSSLPEKNLFHLNIYGEVWDGDYISSQIQKLNLNHLVTIHGFVDEIELDKALASSHLAINLRYPTMGEASGSQLRIWSHALPSLVTKIGWYASLSSETVVFVDPNQEISDIRRHLTNLLSQPQIFQNVGKAGKACLQEHHGPENYVQKILQLAREATALQCRAIAPKLTMRLAMELFNCYSDENLNQDFEKVANGVCFISS